MSSIHVMRLAQAARDRTRVPDGGADREEGAALVAVVLITLLITSLLAVVVASTLTNLQGSSLDRKRTQTAAAAEAGVDSTLATLQISSGTSLPCTVTGSISGASYTATVAYYSTYPPSGSTLTCSNGTVSGSPLAALVTSVGSGAAAYQGAGTSLGDRTMTALVRMTAGTASGPVLDKAVFSDSSVSLTNAWKLMSVSGSDSSLYTNGDFTCNSTPTIAGSVYAQGGGSLTNTCWIDGDLWTNNSISTSTSGVHIGGSIKSTKGGLSEGNHGIYVGKDILVKTTCCGGSPTPKTGDGQNQTVGGVIQTGVSLSSPPSETFPQLTFDTSAYPGFTTQTWANWEKTNATANAAPNWSTAYTGDCTVAGASYSLNGPLVSPSTPTIIDATGCNLSFNTIQVKLNSDLTIFVKSLTSTNGFSATSVDGATHTLRFVVPWPTGGTSCSTVSSSSGGITFNSGGTALPSNVQMMLYTPGQVYMTNSIDFYGQIYGCSVKADSNVTVRYVPVGAGGGSGGTPSSYKVDVAYLRDS